MRTLIFCFFLLSRLAFAEGAPLSASFVHASKASLVSSQKGDDYWILLSDVVVRDEKDHELHLGDLLLAPYGASSKNLAEEAWDEISLGISRANETPESGDDYENYFIQNLQFLAAPVDLQSFTKSPLEHRKVYLGSLRVHYDSFEKSARGDSTEEHLDYDFTLPELLH